MSAVRTWRAGHGTADEDNDNIGIHSVYQAGRIAMLQGIKQVNNYPGVSLFMVTWQHGVAWFCADHSGVRCTEDHSGVRCTEDLLAIFPGSGCNLLGEEGKQFMRVMREIWQIPGSLF